VSPLRLAILVLPVTMAVALAVGVGEPVSDWPIARSAGDFLLHGNLNVYAEHSGAQMGPLALVIAAVLPGKVYLLFVAALLGVFLALILLTGVKERSQRPLLAAALLLAWPWASLAVQGHADDALVLTALAGMLLAHKRAHTTGVVAAFLVAIAAKPTAAVFLPLLFLHSPTALVAGIGGAALLWAPFVLVDPVGFLSAGRGHSDVLHGSVLALLGVEPYSGYPGWVRPAQLGLCLAAAWWLGRRSSWPAAIVGVLALRTLLEPATWNYYSTSVIAGALLFETARGSRVPVLTLAGFLTFVLSYTFFEELPAQLGLLRAAALVGIVVAVIYVKPFQPRPEDQVTAAVSDTGASVVH
jgi:hypothetical protein